MHKPDTLKAAIRLKAYQLAYGLKWQRSDKESISDLAEEYVGFLSQSSNADDENQRVQCISLSPGEYQKVYDFISQVSPCSEALSASHDKAQPQSQDLSDHSSQLLQQ